MDTAALEPFTGYIYPNEYYLQWELLIVLYPYLTGLVAGAFILASLERVFSVKVLWPVYRLALLSALAFLLVAPLPLLAHLGHPERSMEMFLTPHTTSAMAMFGFVYAWYLLVVLLLEIWFDYRHEIILRASNAKAPWRYIYKVLTLGTTDISPQALRFDDVAGRLITIVGIPSAFLLHGYVGFIFGSIKANPWWSSVLMPIVFLFSAIVSGMAMVMLIYMVTSWVRFKPIDMACLNKLGEFLLYALIVDFIACTKRRNRSTSSPC
jgi:predicted membrane protein